MPAATPQNCTPGISEAGIAAAAEPQAECGPRPGSTPALASIPGRAAEAPGDLANLDLLRTFAVCLVLVAHLLETARLRGFGDICHFGVLLFFVHTSLVLMLSMERLGISGAKLYPVFLLRRFFRIYPLSILAVFAALAFHFPSVPWAAAYAPVGRRDALSNLFLTQNITHSGSVICVLWSLPFELQMYAVLPLLFLLLRRYRSVGGAWAIWATGVMIAGLEYLARSDGRDLDFLLTRYVPCFLAGVIAWRMMKTSRKSLPGMLWLLALLFLVASYRLLDVLRVYGPGALGSIHINLRNDHGIWWPPYLDIVRDWLFSVIAGLTIPFFAQIRWQPMNLISKTVAKYSYGIYICHVPILWLCFARMHIASALTAGIFSILLTAITSFALYQLLEEPAIRFGKRMAARLLSSRQSPQVLPDRSAPQLSRSASIPEPFIHILGSRVHLVSAPRAVDIMERWIRPRDGRCHQVVVTGFHGLLEAHKNPGFSAILNSAELWVPDGIAPVWLARIRGYRDAVRAPGTEIMSEFFARAQEKGYSSYFYGDTERTLAALTATAQRLYPGHRVAGTYSPPFRALTAAEDEAILARINAARPDVLWVALGLPKQDVWIYERLHRLNVPVAIGVGAAFAFVAGTVSRCPAWMGNAGFEWVYRLLREPQKLWRRDLFDGPRFLFHAGLELFRTRDYRPPELTRE